MPPVLVTRTYLELPAEVAVPARPAPSGAMLQALARDEVARLRQLYIDVGDAYHWHDRLVWPADRWATYLADAAVRVVVLQLDGRDAGYFELTRAADGSVEIALFGLAAFAQGRGVGRWLLEEAIRAGRAWATGRLWLHTCTLDDPRALPNYRARGFVPWRTEQYTVDA